ncbi:MAG: hypothetical protein ACF8TS_15495 [Maioricimonas sp. JB049]
MSGARYGTLSVCDEPLCLLERLTDKCDRWQLLRIAVSLDELTAQILVKHFVDNRPVSRELLFQRDAPLERFWARIELAFALGLISRPLRTSLLVMCRLSEQILMTLRPGRPMEDEAASGAAWTRCACGRTPGAATDADLSFRVQVFSSVSLISAEMFAVEKQVTRCRERIVRFVADEPNGQEDDLAAILPDLQ